MSHAELAADQPQLTVRKLLSHLAKKDVFNLSQPSDGLAALTEETDSTPIVIQLLVGVGAWVACCCIVIGLLLLGVLTGLLRDGTSAIFCGAILSAAAVFLHRARTGIFSEQLSLSAVMTGVVMFTIGFADPDLMRGDMLGMGLAACFATAVLYVPFDHATFRFMSVAFALTILSIAIGEDIDEEGLHVMILLETIGAGLIFTRLPQSIFRPLGYALAAAMLGTLLVTFLDEMSVWPAALVQVCAQLWLLNFALSTGQKRIPFVLGLSAAAAGLLGLLSAPGILAAVGVTILGHLERDFILRSLGLLFLPVYLVAFYYNLDTSLLAKSGILIASGAILWGARWYLRERVRAGLFDGESEPLS
jgi:hypothetical protein